MRAGCREMISAAPREHVTADEVIAGIVREALVGQRRAVAELVAAVRGHDHPDDGDELDALELVALKDGLVTQVLSGALEAPRARGLIEERLHQLVG